MTKQYIIRGGIVSCEDEQTMDDGTRVVTPCGVVNVSDFVAKLAERANHRIFMPRIKVGYLIAEAKGNNTQVYIVEQRPTVIAITENYDNRERVSAWKIAVPYVYYAVIFVGGGFSQLHVFFNKDAVQTENDPLGQCPLPNQYDDGTVCLGSAINEILSEADNIAKLIDSVTQSFWSSTFNHDLPDFWVNAQRSIRGFPQSFAEWDTITNHPIRRNRILALNWRNSGFTVAKLLDLSMS